MEYKAEAQIDSIDEDETLILAAREDAEEFGRLYDRYYDDIFRYVYHRTFDNALSEDLVSNTFLKALRNISRFKWKRIPFSAWLYQIATNEIRMHYRREKRISASDPPVFPSSTDDIAIEDYALLHQAIMKLRPIHQTIIMLRFFEDMTILEISQVVNKKAGTVKSRLHRGLKELREILIRQGVFSHEYNEAKENG